MLDPVKVAEIIRACQADGLALEEMSRRVGLPLPVVAGCSDTLDGSHDGSECLDDVEGEFLLYVAGQRMADLYWMAQPEYRDDAAPQTAA
jgi:hypothetical protein